MSSEIETPSIKAVPDVGLIIPVRIEIVVVFPAPLVPVQLNLKHKVDGTNDFSIACLKWTLLRNDNMSLKICFIW